MQGPESLPIVGRERLLAWALCGIAISAGTGWRQGTGIELKIINRRISAD